VKYTLSGGFAGFMDTVTVHSDGTVTVTNPVVGERTGTVTPDQLQRIENLLANWCDLPAVEAVGGCCDLLFHSIEYNGRVQSWDDLTRNVPTELEQLGDELESINIAITGGS